MRSGLPVTKELPARRKPTSRKGLERRPRSAHAPFRSRPSLASLEAIAPARKLRWLLQFPEHPDQCRPEANDRAKKHQGHLRYCHHCPSWLGPGSLLASGPFAKATEPMARIAPSVTEGPVFLLHLDKTDEHVLRPEIQMLMQSGRHGLVEGALLIDRSALVQCQLNNHAVL